MDERVRYINVRVISESELKEKDLWFLISNEVKRLFGTLGAAEVGLFLSYFDQKNQAGTFRSSHKYVQRVKTALCFIHTYNNVPIFIYSERVTGSIKKAKELLKDPKNINRYQNLAKILKETSFDDEKLRD